MYKCCCQTRHTLTRTPQEANRQRALERLRRKNGDVVISAPEPRSEPRATPLPTTSFDQIRVGNSKDIKTIPDLPKVQLTPEQRQRIEQNRLKAIEIQQQRQKNHRDGSTTDSVVSIVTERDVKRQKLQDDLKSRYQPPPINKKDYIEYDFSTMKDSKGGFINVDEPSANTEDQTTLEQWKESHNQLVKDPAPPIDIEKAPKCFECNSIDINFNFYENFRNVRVCKNCIKQKPEKYSLLTKTECREDYLLTDPELKDTSLLPRIEKPNPHGYSRMQLFLRFQVEEFAWKKWGSPEGLDEEWQKREDLRIKRRDKKYNDKLKEMRKKTRAEEYTRKLRNGQDLGERHVHDWSAPVAIPGELNMVKRRCIDCGVETEEVII